SERSYLFDSIALDKFLFSQLFFFFQAEDGIRDFHVTGVQTCALPISPTNLIEVKSPMVGTFYRAPAPEAPPYVEVGSRVTKGQTLCILEAMKLMNELESEVDGIVREILVANAEPVEYGQVLFRIEPTGA